MRQEKARKWKGEERQGEGKIIIEGKREGKRREHEAM